MESMCKMDKCKQDNNMVNGLGLNKTNRFLKNILSIVFKKESNSLDGVNFYETLQSTNSHFVLDYRTKVLISMSQDNFIKKVNNVQTQNNQHKIYNFKQCIFLVIRKSFKPQAGFLSDAFDAIKNAINLVSTNIHKVNNLVEFSKTAVKNGDAWLLFVELFTLILNIREGFVTPTTILTTILSMYTICKRVSNVFKPQFLESDSYEAASIFLSFIGVPDSISKILKDYTSITGKRLFSSSFVFDLLSSLYTVFKIFLNWLSDNLEVTGLIITPITHVLDFVFGNILCYSNVKNVATLYTKYTSSPNVILQPDFRNQVSLLYDRLKGDVMFSDYVMNHENRFFREIWHLFVNNLVRYVNTFTSSAKEEPICIVFEGKPGSGKSVLMNNFVEYLKSQNRTVYVHSVPPTEGGKDFYDDYENQEVFVMDDVGQQGKSQWRTIINFVSPVKYPLDCASANKKNTKFFNSKIILCTTNGFMDLNAFTSKDCISEPQALFRRCHVIKVERSIQSDESFLQDLSYFKFDHVNDQKWKNSFLYHNSKIEMPSSIKRQEKIKCLTYIRMLLSRLEINEETNRRSTEMTKDDIDMMNVDTINFDPQFDIFTKLSDFLGKLSIEWKDIQNGTNLFTEWFLGIIKPCQDLISFITKYVTQFITGKNKDSEIVTIMRARSPIAILGVNNYQANFRKLAAKYHPDKYRINDEYSLEESTFAFLLISLAKQHYLDPNKFSDERDSMFRNSCDYFQRLMDFGTSELGVQHRTYIYSRFKQFLWYLYHVMFVDDDRHVQWIFVTFYSLYICICFYAIFHSNTKDLSNHKNYGLKEKVLTASKLALDSRLYIPQVSFDNTISKFCKFVVIKSDDRSDIISHAIVSGNRLLINSHIDVKNPIVNVYSTYEHYENNHPELELIRIKLIKDYMSCDLSVYEFIHMHSVYPTCSPIFRSRNITPILYLCTSIVKIPLIFDKNVFINDFEVEYSMYNKSFKHMEGTGLITPCEGEGLCGSFIYNSSGDIIGIHAAGDGKRGFCAIPSESTAEMIRQDMMSVRNMQLEIADEKRFNFSGARLVYPSESIETTYPSSRNTIRESVLHVDNCSEMAEFISHIHEEDSDLVYTPINKRGPPIIQNPVQTIKNTSMKTFMNQGTVTTDEIKFIKECIRSLMPNEDYDDLSDHETAFGNEVFTSLNHDSSNGYGHPKGKKSYFDFENKIILPEFQDEFKQFLSRVETGEYEYKDFLSKECFKVDELRDESKREKPRTVRVLPVTHIFLTKKVFGKLALHFKKFNHETGIGLGFNPFKDFDLLYKKLSDPNITVTGDLDAAKWDGSLVALIMEAILEVMFEKYKGKYLSTRDFLITSMVRSFVLVADELYMTTHGLPTGIWVTFLLNSLFNRALDALVIYRNVPQYNVQSFLDLVSYVTGDDKIFGVPKHLAQYVNLLTFRKVFESLGMTATNGDKTEITKPSQSLGKLTYLKRHMRFHPILKRWVGALSINTILNMTQWVDTTKDTYEAMSGKIRSSQIEAFIHSSSFFHRLTSIFSSVLGHDYLFFNEQQVINILSREDAYEQTIRMRGSYDYSEITNITNQPEFIDKKFIQKSSNDFFTDKENLTTTVASISTREIQMIPSIANDLFTQVDIDEAYRVDAKPYIERPFFAGSLEFTIIDPRYTLLSTPISSLPGDIIRSNPSLLGAMKIGSYYRADLVLNISMGGTITHAGKILVGAVPPMPLGIIQSGKDWINTILSGPHASLFANEATSVMISIPWYCNSDLATLDMDTSQKTSLDITPINGNYSNLFFLVQNPLAPSNGSSQSLSIIIEACFKNLDIVVPTPRLVKWNPQAGFISGLTETVKNTATNVVGDFIDKAANWFTDWTGLHNPNIPTVQERDIVIPRNLPNTCDAPQYFEKLDPFTQFNRIVKSPLFGSEVDEMSISHIVSKKQFLGTFTVKTDDPVGTLLWSRPISPFQGGFGATADYLTCVNNLELMHSLHRAWRGGLEITIESVMNNKQQVKLRLLKLYNPSVEASLSTPVYNSIANAPSSLMEFTQGGQEHIVSLPYLCRNDLTPCSEDLKFEGLFHGMYYIYLAQPLVNSDGSPTSIEFNIYMRGDKDLTFYGYVPRNIQVIAFPVTELVPEKPIFKPQSGDVNSITVMNEPQSQSNPISEDSKTLSISHFDRLLPNLDLRPLVRRMYPLQVSDALGISADNVYTEIVPLADIIGEVPVSVTQTTFPSTPISIISRMFYSKTAGFKFQITLQSFKQDEQHTGVQDLQVFAMYVPPNLSANYSTATVAGCPINTNTIDPNVVPLYKTAFPFQEIPIYRDSTTVVYEFSIPDTTYYKFMGSPLKFLYGGTTYEKLSTMDFGSLYLRYSNLNAKLPLIVKRSINCGLTDESRFGHHAMATPFKIAKYISPYLTPDGTPGGGTVPTTTGPKAMYFGGFI